jgi:OOP family OmpA-OmpF porin
LRARREEAIALGVKLLRIALVFAGAVLVAAIALVATVLNGPSLIAGIQKRAEAARDRAGGHDVALSFQTRQGWLTRHPDLSGGHDLDDATRARTAAAIANTPGVGGVHWRSRGSRGGVPVPMAGEPGHCQSDVEAIVKARSIRFSRASSAIDPASQSLLDEVAAALKPCAGGIIAVTGHTNRTGNEAANIALSQARANAVRAALIGRGIPADGLRTMGLGSSRPLPGLDPVDPANRRIDFSVIEKVRIKPTPIDTPGPD